MSIIVLCIILTITEIVLLARHKLKPLAFLIMNVVKSTIWTAIFVIDVISVVGNNSRTASAIAIIIEAVLLYVIAQDSLPPKSLTLSLDYASGSPSSTAQSYTTVSEKKQNPTSLSIIRCRILSSPPNTHHNTMLMCRRMLMRKRAQYRAIIKGIRDSNRIDRIGRALRMSQRGR